MVQPTNEPQSTFQAWINLASTPSSIGEELQNLQSQLDQLDNLLTLLSDGRSLAPGLAVSIIKTIFSSGFGTYQHRRESWAGNDEAIRIAESIHHLTILICLEVLCIGQIVVGTDEQEDEDEENDGKRARSELMDSRDSLFDLHGFISQRSDFLRYDQPEVVPDAWPVAAMCLAWAIVLNTMPEDQRFSSHSSQGDRAMVQEFLARALGNQAGLLAGLKGMLSGSLFNSGPAEDEGLLDKELIRRRIVKDLVMGLSDLVQVEDIQPYQGLVSLWHQLFSGVSLYFRWMMVVTDRQGSPAASVLVCEDYWIADYPHSSRRAILERSHFPQSFTLPYLLSALSGQGNSEPASQAGLQLGPTFTTFDTFSALSQITLPLHCIGGYRNEGEDGQGRITISTTKTISLPGGVEIPAERFGTSYQSEDGSRWVTLDGPLDAWPLLFEILRVASGLHPHVSSDSADYVRVSIQDLHVPDDIYTLQMIGLSLFKAVLDPSVGLPKRVFETLSTGIESPAVAILEIALSALQNVRSRDMPGTDISLASSALTIVRHLLFLSDSATWTALRSSYFFGPLGKRGSIAASLIDLDSRGSSHDITLAVLSLVGGIVTASASTSLPDERIVRPALHLAYTSVWQQASGWRYDDMARKYELFTFLVSAFGTVLAHPAAIGRSGLSEPAEYLVDLFIHNASMGTYRPLQEVLVTGLDQAVRLNEKNRRADASLVIETIEKSLTFLATLLRVGAALDVSSNALPKSILSVPIVTPASEKMLLIDHIFQLALLPALPTSTQLVALRLVRTFLLSTANDSQRPSLAALLGDAKATCAALANLAADSESEELKALAWDVLGAIVTVQPGCAIFCIGESEKVIEGPLVKAIEAIGKWKDLAKTSPVVLSAITNYCLAVVSSPRAANTVSLLRSHPSFWSDVTEIARRRVNAPPTFLLSMHADDFAGRIRSYAYETQAKANSMSLLASELRLIVDDDEAERTSKAREMVCGSFKSGEQLVESVSGAAHNNCYPELHEAQGGKLVDAGVSLEVLRTTSLFAEREYGVLYLYGELISRVLLTSDGDPRFPHDEIKQGTVNFALDMLNLNWSMLEADTALTKAFTSLAESTLPWTEGDLMVSGPALKASVQLAQTIAEEDRSGDVMLAIQNERLGLLVVLIEMACVEEASNDQTQLISVCESLKRILESSDFPPTAALRYPNLPALHRPLLRILSLVLQAISRTDTTAINIDSAIIAATVFTLDAADTVLDILLRPTNAERRREASADLASVVAVLCEVTRTNNATIWLDRVAEHNLIARSLEVISRTPITDGQVPSHIASILLLHLALASQPLFAERLAVSGIMPTYSHNAIAVEAEQGNITPSTPSPTAATVHGAWCGMLTVVKALLTSLPPTTVVNFAKSEVLPFTRVATPQFQRSLSWYGETPLDLPTIYELELVTDVFYGIIQAIGPNRSLLYESGSDLVQLLHSVRYALSHPTTLSQSFVASSEEEREALTRELEKVDNDSDTRLLDFAETPIIAERILRILGVTRSVVLTLVTLSRAWDVLQGEDHYKEGEVIEKSDEVKSAIDDIVGVLTDIYTLVSPLSASLPTAAPSHTKGILSQLSESLAVLATAQILHRSTAFSFREKDADHSMDIDGGGKRRRSLGVSGQGEKLLLELAGDVIASLPENGDRLLVKLRSKLVDAFPDQV